MSPTVIYTIDIGNSHIRGGVAIDGMVQILTVASTPHNRQEGKTGAHLISLLRSVIDEISAKAPPMKALAISSRGVIDLKANPGARNYGPFQDTEPLVTSVNINGLCHVPLMRLIEEMGYDVPVHIENNANAALHATAAFQDAICIMLDEGLSASVRKNGKIVHPGDVWSCFEIGHGLRWQFAEHFSRTCHCGSIGCLEAAIAGWAMTERYMVRPQLASEKVMNEMRSDVLELLPQAIAELVRQTKISSIFIGGTSARLYSQKPNFLHQLRERTQKIVPNEPISLSLLPNPETAEMRGVARALVRNIMLETTSSLESPTEASAAC